MLQAASPAVAAAPLASPALLPQLPSFAPPARRRRSPRALACGGAGGGLGAIAPELSSGWCTGHPSDCRGAAIRAETKSGARRYEEMALTCHTIVMPAQPRCGTNPQTVKAKHLGGPLKQNLLEEARVPELESHDEIPGGTSRRAAGWPNMVPSQ